MGYLRRYLYILPTLHTLLSRLLITVSYDPLRRYFSGLAAVGYSLLLFSLLLDHDLYDADNNLLEGDCRVVVCPVA